MKKGILAIICASLLMYFIASPSYASGTASVRKKVRFVNPVDAFTIYAFLNYTGYDEENHTAYHPVRSGIRDDLKDMHLEISRPEYYKEFVNYWGLESDMAAFTGWIGVPPNFKMDPAMRDVLGKYVHRDLGELDVLLKEFYMQANIGSLYQKYKPWYDQIVEDNEESVYKALERTVEYFRVDLDDIRDLDIFINLMDMHFRGYMIDPAKFCPNTDKPYLLQIGPEPGNTINIQNIVHEFSHILTNNAFSEAPSELRQLITSLYYEYGDAPQDGSYPSWEHIVDESFVRAMDSWVTDQPMSHVKNEVAQGFILTEFVYNRIEDFSKDENLGFVQWVKTVMLDLVEEIGAFEGKDYQEGYDAGYLSGYNKNAGDRKLLLTLIILLGSLVIVGTVVIILLKVKTRKP